MSLYYCDKDTGTALEVLNGTFAEVWPMVKSIVQSQPSAETYYSFEAPCMQRAARVLTHFVFSASARTIGLGVVGM